jgi:hypothetical protein
MIGLETLRPDCPNLVRPLLAAPWLVCVPSLLANQGKGVAKWRARNLNQPTEGLVQVDD